MKFVHVADIHLDRPFVKLSDKGNLGNLKRIEQKKIFKEVIEYIKENDIECLFIAGDLYEHKYVKESTIEYINKLFHEIKNTKVFITPGNHDPNIKNSYYNKFNWSENVVIFSKEIKKVELEDTDIYGFGFTDFYCREIELDGLEIENKNKNNVLIMHGNLDGAKLDDKEYNPIKSKTLGSKGFDYVALGHIHKTNFGESKNIIYPGSLVSLGFDEIGNHGMIVGEINNKNLEINFVPLGGSTFVEKEIDITNIYSIEELIQKIEEIRVEENEYMKINLTGKRNFEIDVYYIYSMVQNMRIIKIKDLTEIKYDYKELKNENTLRGLFVKNMMKQLEEENLTDEKRKILEHGIEIGLEVLK